MENRVEKENHFKQVVVLLLILLNLFVTITNEIPSFHSHATIGHDHSLDTCGGRSSYTFTSSSAFQLDALDELHETCPYLLWNLTSQSTAILHVHFDILAPPFLEDHDTFQKCFSQSNIQNYLSRAPPAV